MRDLSRRDLLRVAAVAAAGSAAGCTGHPPTSPSPAPGTSGPVTFPPDFAWGVATSAYQIEGAVAEDGRGPSVWDAFCAQPHRIADASSGSPADDHYHCYQEDLDLMKELHIRSYRFSISWPRILPDGAGSVNTKGLDFYRKLLEGLHARGITPMATLWHWDTPQALQDRVGGWESRECAQRFADYAGIVGERLGDLVPAWLTVNEPKTQVQVGYLSGDFAPGRQDPDAATKALHHLMLGHGLAVAALRAAAPKSKVGAALNLAPVYPADDADATHAVHVRDVAENTAYLDPVFKGRYPDGLHDAGFRRPALESVLRDGDLERISVPIDLLGVNYYNPAFVRADGRTVRKYPVASPANWLEIYPPGLYDTLLRLRRDYGNPLTSVTENGRPDAPDTPGDGLADQARIDYLRDHLVQARRAIADGARLGGYHAWSLLDNFEWSRGYTQRFGLVHVDYPTQKRTPKQSARWYADVIARGSL
ncbi:GH1 family beta-glucosidase [Amycolatopsis sp. NPDC051128]|uniref:GH1 family beta-glucosidase n=1 Tax=Amycolatopsis sp. NPDC051128 TaxID=3155412 RepID=UPI003426E641